ncbi:MAG: hypothetical protein U1F77_18750 [Kiritimatiellia bacterium]
MDAHIARCVNPNLLAAFAGYCPFQIDGNMATPPPSARCLQSHVQTGRAGAYEIEPARPSRRLARRLRARPARPRRLRGRSGVEGRCADCGCGENPHGGACWLRLRTRWWS